MLLSTKQKKFLKTIKNEKERKSQKTRFKKFNVYAMNKEQLAYYKSLTSNKTKRQFLDDILFNSVKLQ